MENKKKKKKERKEKKGRVKCIPFDIILAVDLSL